MNRSLRTAVTPSRLPEIDGLRGLAALAVVLFHFHGELLDELTRNLPQLVVGFLSLGYLGVTVFFVLSGFVITLSTDRHRVTLEFAGQFVLRRSLRLDPPYWASITLVIALTAIKNHVFPEYHASQPTWPSIAAHLLYLQNILGFEDLLPIYWTLCFEVQFYLALLLVLFILQRTVSDRDTVTSLKRKTPQVLLLATGLLSAATYVGIVQWHVPGSAHSAWCFFCLGMFTYWARTGHTTPLTVCALALGMLALAACAGQKLTPVCAAIATAGIIYAANKKNLIRRLLGINALQYLGTISYSVYLFHGIIGWTAVSLLKHYRPYGRLIPDTMWTLITLMFGITVSISAGAILHTLIERPSIMLSKKIRTSTL